MNEQIHSFLNDYASLPSPQYAIILRGKWGCGKTYFVKKWLSDFEPSNHHPSDENRIELKPIYVSLFGMREIKDIKSAIDRRINPFFYSKTGKILKMAGRIASKIVFKTELDLDKDGKGETSFSGTLDSLSIFESDDKKEISGIKFIIFDDLERCQIPMKQLLGFFNYFVEHCDCHVVLVGEEKYLDDKPQKELQEFKEKVVGREFEIFPDVEEAINQFVSLPRMATSFLEKEINTIKLSFECTEINNLRLLRQALQDFSMLVSSLGEELVESNHEYLCSLLSCFIAVYAEYHSKENHDFIVGWDDYYTKALCGRGEDLDKIRAMIGKYSKIDSLNQFEALSSTIVPKIVEYLENGNNLAPMFRQILSRQKGELSALERLDSYWDKSNEEFDEIYDSLIRELEDGTISEPVEMGKSIAYLGFFDAKDLRKFPKAEFTQIEKTLIDKLRSCQNLADLFGFHYRFMQGYNFVRGRDHAEMITKDMIEYFNQVFEEMKNNMPDDMQLALRQLSDGNVESLIYLDSKERPDATCPYQLSPIFHKEDSKQLFASLRKMSNKGRNAFRQFLSYHYKLHDDSMLGNVYKPDYGVLVELRNLLAQEAASKVSVERMSYDELLNYLDKAISKTKGETKLSSC